MSLIDEFFSDVPSDTAHTAQSAFPKGNLYIKMRHAEPGTFFEDFADLFPARGQPKLIGNTL